VGHADSKRVGGLLHPKIRVEVSRWVPSFVLALHRCGEKENVFVRGRFSFRPNDVRLRLVEHNYVVGLLVKKAVPSVYAGRSPGEVVVSGEDVDRNLNVRETLAGSSYDVVSDGIVVEEVTRNDHELCSMFFGYIADPADHFFSGLLKRALRPLSGPVERSANLEIRSMQKSDH
jgi:hypothetical protein